MCTQHKGHHIVTRKGIGMSRAHQLTHQLTCRIPRAPSHCRTGSFVDVTATGFPVTDECSRWFLPSVHPSVSVLGLSSTCCCPCRGPRPCHFHRSRVPLQLNFKLLKPTSSSAGARSIGCAACGCTPFFSPCDKKGNDRKLM